MTPMGQLNGAAGRHAAAVAGQGPQVNGGAMSEDASPVGMQESSPQNTPGAQGSAECADRVWLDPMHDEILVGQWPGLPRPVPCIPKLVSHSDSVHKSCSPCCRLAVTGCLDGVLYIHIKTLKDHTGAMQREDRNVDNGLRYMYIYIWYYVLKWFCPR